MSKDEHKPALQCVNIKLKHNAVHAAACDGTRLMMIKDAAGSPDEREFLLPGRSLQMLSSISNDKDVFEVGDMGNEVVFMRSDTMFTMRKLPGEYMDTTAVLKSIIPVYSAVTDAIQIKEALNLIMASAGKEPVNMALFDGSIHLCRNSDLSEAKSIFSATVSKETPEEGFYYDADNLLKLFQVMDGRIKLEIDAKGVMLVKTRNEVYFQLPRRVPVKNAEVTAGAKRAA